RQGRALRQRDVGAFTITGDATEREAITSEAECLGGSGDRAGRTRAPARKARDGRGDRERRDPTTTYHRAETLRSDLLAASAHLGEHRGQTELVDAPHPAGRHAERDPALLVLEPEPLVQEVDLEAPLGVAVRVADVVADD